MIESLFSVIKPAIWSKTVDFNFTIVPLPQSLNRTFLFIVTEWYFSHFAQVPDFEGLLHRLCIFPNLEYNTRSKTWILRNTGLIINIIPIKISLINTIYARHIHSSQHISYCRIMSTVDDPLYISIFYRVVDICECGFKESWGCCSDLKGVVVEVQVDEKIEDIDVGEFSGIFGITEER